MGLLVYGIGSLTTSLSPDPAVLLLGWSLVEGLGAVLVMPAIAALIAANYEGKRRATGYAMVGAIAAIAIAAGPLIGGWVITEFSWRYVFAAETVVVLLILAVRRRMRPPPPPERRPSLDYVGVALSALGLAIIVCAVLRTSDWGWIRPKGAPEIAGHEITPFGFSVVPFMILAGLGIIGLFVLRQERRARQGRDRLLDTTLLRIPQLRSGLQMLLAQQLLLLGVFFVLPVYLQVVLGFDAFEAGLRLLPLSVAMLIAALLGPWLAERLSPKRVVQLGLLAIATSALLLLGTVDVELDEAGFRTALAVFGAGAGLLASQLGNVIMSSVGPEKTNEAGGLQGTAQNLGASLGTALVGAVLLHGLTAGFQDRIAQEPSLPADVRTQLVDATADDIDIIPVDQAEQAMVDAGVPADQAATIADAHGQTQIDGLKDAFLVVALLALLSFWLTRTLAARAADRARRERAGTVSQPSRSST